MQGTILVTGGTGFIGSHTTVALHQAGYRVLILDNLCNSSTAALDAIATITGVLPEFVQGDIRDAPLLDTLFASHSISAVLHFARDESHFEAMLRQLWRVLKPRGLFFARLASTIGLGDGAVAIGNGRYRLPDGSDRFLIDAAGIDSWTQTLGGKLVDPIKTTVVHEQRSMTTWVAVRD